MISKAALAMHGDFSIKLIILQNWIPECIVTIK